MVQHFIKTIRDDYTSILVTLSFLLAGMSTLLDTPTTIAHTAPVLAQIVWTVFIVGGSVARLIWHFCKNLDFLRVTSGIAILVGSYVYLVGLLFTPTASWFICIILVVPTFQQIDRWRHEKRIAKANGELLELKEKLEHRTYYVDE